MASLQTILDAYAKAGRDKPDAAGLAYWQDPANNFEAAFKSSINDPTAQANAAQMDPGYGQKLTDVQNNYQNLFGRTGEGEGAAYWVGTGLTGSDLTNAMMKSADQIAAQNPKGTGDSISPYTTNGTGFNAAGQPVTLQTTTPPTSGMPTTPVVNPATSPSNPAANTAYKAETGGIIASAQKIAPVNQYTATKANTPDSPTAIEATTPDKLAATKATTPGAYTAEQATVSNWTVDPNQTVDAQLTRILGEDSDYMRSNVADAIGYMNSRGGLNTTMAAEAGRKAGIAAALPMASQNATTYAQAASQNASMGTDVSKSNAAARNEALMARFQMEGKNEQDFAAAQNAMDLTDYNTRAKVAQDFAKTKNDINIQVYMTKALNEQNFAAAQNLARQLKFQADVEAAGGDATAANALIMQSNNIQADVNKAYAEAQNSMARQQTEISAQQYAQARDIASKEYMQAVDSSFQTAMQTLKGTQASALAKIEADSRQTIQNSDTVAKIFTASTNAITAIKSMPTTQMSDEMKNTAVDQMVDMLQSSLAVAGGAGKSDIDYTSLLDWTRKVPVPVTPVTPA